MDATSLSYVFIGHQQYERYDERYPVGFVNGSRWTTQLKSLFGCLPKQQYDNLHLKGTIPLIFMVVIG